MNPSDTQAIAKLIAGGMIERRDAKAVQSRKGAYHPARVDPRDPDSDLIPWRLSDVVDHLEGKATYGHYVVSTEGTCRMFVFDIDLRKRAKPELDEPPIMFDGEEIDPREVWAGPVSPARRHLALDLRCMAEGLARKTHAIIDGKVLVTYSGNKGMHVYGLLDPGTAASEAREVARLVLESIPEMIPEHGNNFFRHESAYQSLQVEVFPKQDGISSTGFGNLVRLPLGVHQKTGKPGFFLDLSTDIRKTGIDNPLTALTEGSIR